MSLLPVAVYTLEVPCDGTLVPALLDFPATFRLTMAAIDPSAEPKNAEGTTHQRATLKIVREPLSMDDEDDDFDEEYMRMIGGSSDSEEDDDEEDDSDDEEVNGGPSDPSKSKKARKAAAVQQLLDALNNDSDDEEEAANGINGLSNVDKGKGKATDDEEDEDEDMIDGKDDDEDDDDDELEETVLCTLDPEKHYQQTLDITVAENEEVYFKVTGTHTIYLTGNFVVPQDDESGRDGYDSDEDSEDDEEYDLSPDEDELDVDLEMDEESDKLDDLENPRVTEVDSEDEAPKLVKAEGKEDKKGKNKRSADELDESATLDAIIAKEEPKLSKKQLKKLKKNNGEAAPAKPEDSSASAKSPKSDKSDKKVQFAKNLEQGPTGSAEKPKVPSTPGKAALGKRNVNGVDVEDKKVGTGPAARNGNKLELRYIGKLQNGKLFDANKSGKPFSFKMGKGEVIKGWDLGVAGMQVGGERRLTIPPKLAYGSKKMDSIPANSTLIFDIKLLSIS